MLNAFVKVATAASEIGKIDSAMLYSSGMISIDGTDGIGRVFHITCRFEDIQEQGNEHP